MLKSVLIILDGLGDERSKELSATPLEYLGEKIKNFNRLAEKGVTGLMHTIKAGVPPSSDTAHLTIFGYDLEKDYPGRGYFEALGAGLKPKFGEIAFRANFATVREENGKLIVVDRRAGRISGEDADVLGNDLNKYLREQGYPVEFVHTLEHRGVLLIKPDGHELSSKITDVDPHELGFPILKSQPFEGLDEEERRKAEFTARILNDILVDAYRFLRDHPINKERAKRGLPVANALLVRGAGIVKKLESFKEKWGYKAAFVAAGPLYRGVALSLGMDPIEVEGATGLPNTNIKGKLEGVIRAFKQGYEFVFVHIKATDNLSHSKKPREKAEFIKKVDDMLIVLDDILDEAVIAVTGDHSTSSVRGKHVGLPVPILIHSPYGRPDENKYFNEKACEKGGLGIIHGNEVMPLILDLSDRANELGIRTSPKPVYYIGSTGEPLKI